MRTEEYLKKRCISISRIEKELGLTRGTLKLRRGLLPAKWRSLVTDYVSKQYGHFYEGDMEWTLMVDVGRPYDWDDGVSRYVDDNGVWHRCDDKGTGHYIDWRGEYRINEHGKCYFKAHLWVIERRHAMGKDHYRRYDYMEHFKRLRHEH